MGFIALVTAYISPNVDSPLKYYKTRALKKSITCALVSAAGQERATQLFNKNPGNNPIPLKKRILKIVIRGVIGIGVGLLYYQLIGYRSGSCAITSNPYASAVYGMVFGALLGSF